MGASQRTEGDSDVFVSLDQHTHAVVRARMIDAILATDMTHHGDHVHKIQRFQLQDGIENSQSETLVNLLLHIADISNPMMPRDISVRWASAVAEEFTLQVEKERALGLPVTGFMDGLADKTVASKANLGFIDFVCRPLAESAFKV